MPSDAIIDTTSNRTPEKLIPYISGSLGIGWKTHPFWYVPELVEPIGINPGYALINVPAASLDGYEQANAIAFTNNLPSQFRHGTRVAIKRKSSSGIEQTCFVGTIVEVSHDRSTDGLAIKAIDDRLLLQNIYIVGQFCISNYEAGTPTIVYRQGEDCRFNPQGRPNCIDVNFGGHVIPVFTPYPDFRSLPDTDPPNKETGGILLQLQARYWTLSDILRYARFFYASDVSSSIDALTNKWPWLTNNKVDQEIIEWPESFGSNLDLEAISNFDNQKGNINNSSGSNRKGRDINLTGMNLLDALDLILTSAGGWTINLEGQFNLDEETQEENFKNTLVAVPYIYTGGGIDIPYSASGDIPDKATVTDGTFKENSEDYVNAVIVEGDRVAIETRIDTLIQDAPGEEIRFKWSQDEEEEFKEYWADFPDDDGFREAENKQPFVFAAYDISPLFNFLAGTVYSSYPRAQIARLVKTHLVSWRGSGKGDIDYSNFYYNIPLEFKDDNGVWQHGLDLNGLEIFDDGTLFVPALRNPNLKMTWKGQGVDSIVDGKADMQRRDIRLTVAFYADHRITSVATFTSDVQSDLLFDLVYNNPDGSRIDPTISKRIWYIRTGSLYKCDLRKDSFPISEAAGGTEFNDKTTLSSAVRADVDEITAHSRRALYERGRLNKEGNLIIDGYLTTEYKPGMAVRYLTPVGTDNRPMPANAIIGARVFQSAPGLTRTVLRLQ